MADFEKIMSVALPALAGLGGALDPSRRVPQALTNVVSMRTMLRGQEDRRAHMEAVENRAQASQEREQERFEMAKTAFDRQRDVEANFDAQRAEFLDNPNLPDDLRQLAQVAKSSSDLAAIIEAAHKRTTRKDLGETINRFSDDPFIEAIASVAPELAGTYVQARAGKEGRNYGNQSQDELLANVQQILASVGPGLAASGSVQLPGGGNVTISKPTDVQSKTDVKNLNQIEKEIEVLDEDYQQYLQKATQIAQQGQERLAKMTEVRGKPPSELIVKAVMNGTQRELDKLEKENKYFNRARDFVVNRASKYEVEYEVKPRIGPDGQLIPSKQVTPEAAAKERDKKEKEAIRERQMAIAGGEAPKEPGVATTGQYSTEYQRLKSNAADLFGIKE